MSSTDHRPKTYSTAYPEKMSIEDISNLLDKNMVGISMKTYPTVNYFQLHPLKEPIDKKDLCGEYKDDNGIIRRGYNIHKLPDYSPLKKYISIYITHTSPLLICGNISCYDVANKLNVSNISKSPAEKKEIFKNINYENEINALFTSSISKKKCTSRFNIYCKEKINDKMILSKKVYDIVYEEQLADGFPQYPQDGIMSEQLLKNIITYFANNMSKRKSDNTDVVKQWFDIYYKAMFQNYTLGQLLIKLHNYINNLFPYTFGKINLYDNFHDSFKSTQNQIVHNCKNIKMVTPKDTDRIVEGTEYNSSPSIYIQPSFNLSVTAQKMPDSDSYKSTNISANFTEVVMTPKTIDNVVIYDENKNPILVPKLKYSSTGVAQQETRQVKRILTINQLHDKFKYGGLFYGELAPSFSDSAVGGNIRRNAGIDIRNGFVKPSVFNGRRNDINTQDICTPDEEMVDDDTMVSSSSVNMDLEQECINND